MNITTKPTTAQMKVIVRSNSKYNNLVSFKVHERTLVGMIKAGYIELFVSKKPYYSEGYRLTEKSLTLVGAASQ